MTTPSSRAADAAGGPPARLRGTFAALPTPVGDDGRPDLDALAPLLSLVLEAGVTGVCLSGATGEYVHLETADRVALVRRAARLMPADRVLLTAIGAPSRRLTIDLGRAAFDAGSRAVLLPMPGFFKYEQDDLAAYAQDVSDALAGPCLLYNLPVFTNGLTAETLVSVMTSGRHVVGVKDSSGDLATIAALSGAAGREAWSLLVGDDRRVRAGLAAGWDGVVSGMAACAPELAVALARSAGGADGEEAVRLQARLDELIRHLMVLPVPWGIRVALAARGLPTGPLPLPVTAARRRQIEEIAAWFPGWLRGLGTGIGGAPAAR